MPLGYDPFDFRKYLPPEASMYTLAAAADGSPPPSFTAPVPVAPEVPVRRVATTPAAPVVVPEPTPSPMAPRTDASAPLVEGTSDPYHTPISRKVPEVVTPLAGATPDLRLIPTAASTAPPVDTWYQRLAKLAQGDDFSGAGKALAGMFPKKPPAPHPFKVSGPSGGGGGVRDLSGSGQQMLANIMKGRKTDLVAGGMGKKPKQARQDDLHEYEQERFDWRRAQGRRR